MKFSAIVVAGALLLPAAARPRRVSPTRRSRPLSSPPTRSISTPGRSPRRWAARRSQEVRGPDDHGPYRRQQAGGRARDQAEGHARGQRDEPEPQGGRREERRQPEDAEGRGVRQGLHRSRGRVSPAGARRGRQDADPECQATPSSRRCSSRCGRHSSRTSSTRSTFSPRWGRPLHDVCGASVPVPALLDCRRLESAAGCRALPDQARGAAIAAGQPKTHTVTIEATSFKPERLTVAAGDTVVWVNKDPFPHTATATAGGFDSGNIDPEKSWTLTAVKKGEFGYVCSLHPTMKARLKVE